MNVKKNLIKGIYLVNEEGEETGEYLEFYDDGTYSLSADKSIDNSRKILLINKFFEKYIIENKINVFPTDYEGKTKIEQSLVFLKE